MTSADRPAPPAAPVSEPAPDLDDPRVREAIDRFWRANVRTVVGLLAIWGFVGLGCGVLWADWLNQFHVGGFPLGFWFAQQGSIVVFVAIVLAYAVRMTLLDRRHRAELRRLRTNAERDA